MRIYIIGNDGITLVFTAVSLDQDVMLAYAKAQLRADEFSLNCRRLLQVTAEAEARDG
jgi:hypothetical protein